MFYGNPVIVHDWLEPTDTDDATETQYIDHLLDDWGHWQRNNGVRLSATAAGQVLGINTSNGRVWDLTITDDQFTQLDRSIARLPSRLKAIVFLEYIAMGPQPEKWGRSGLNRLAYRQRLHAAQWALFTSLVDVIDKWRQKIVNSEYS